jgi:hypothetical protein
LSGEAIQEDLVINEVEGGTLVEKRQDDGIAMING